MENNEKTSMWNKPASEITIKESMILTGVATAAMIAVPVVILVGTALAEKINEVVRNRKKKPTLVSVEEPK